MKEIFALTLLAIALFFLLKRFLVYDERTERQRSAEYLGDYYERPRRE